MSQHTQARSERNAAYAGMRFCVPDHLVSWGEPWVEYAPIEFTHASVLAQPAWADANDVKEVADLITRASFEGGIFFEPDGRPRNPRGRTGTTGRGLLGKWGPNHAADPIVFRRKPPAPGAGEPAHGDVLFQMVAIKRKDTGEWAIPGGMVDKGENVSLTLRREFTEEAGALEDPGERALFETQLDTIFSNGRCVYDGYVDDPRNTDNAWIETTAHLFYVEDEKIAQELKLVGGDDASHARWIDVDGALLAGDNNMLYADHREFVRRALEYARGDVGCDAA